MVNGLTQSNFWKTKPTNSEAEKETTEAEKSVAETAVEIKEEIEQQNDETGAESKECADVKTELPPAEIPRIESSQLHPKENEGTNEEKEEENPQPTSEVASEAAKPKGALFKKWEASNGLKSQQQEQQRPSLSQTRKPWSQRTFVSSEKATDSIATSLTKDISGKPWQSQRVFKTTQLNDEPHGASNSSPKELGASPPKESAVKQWQSRRVSKIAQVQEDSSLKDGAEDISKVAGSAHAVADVEVRI